MRADMFKVIVERPRRGGHGARKGRVVDDGLLPSKLGLRRAAKERGDWKRLNENLQPLYRFCQRQVGRPWNKVFSEICANLSVRNTVQKHVLDHLDDIVDLHLARDRRVHKPGLYVDPRDGILKSRESHASARYERARLQASQAAAAKAPPDRTSVGDRHYRRVGGIWYEVDYAPMPVAEYQARERQLKIANARNGYSFYERGLVTPEVDDIIDGFIPVGPSIDTRLNWQRYNELHPHRRYTIAKRQLSRTELRRLNLQNADEQEAR